MDDPPPLIRPTPGAVRTGFRYDRATPFAARQRRGITLAARPGATVAAPCRGRVTFAGRTPRGPGVTVRCGGWTAAVLGVAPTVRPGTTVAAGRTVGRASRAVVGLSLRPVAERWGYVDPRPSLAAPRTGTPLGPAPRPRQVPGSPRSVSRVPRPSTRPVPVPGTLGRPLPTPVTTRPAPVPAEPRPSGPVRADPRVVVVGLILAAAGVPALRRRRSSGRRVAAGGPRYLSSVDR